MRVNCVEALGVGGVLDQVNLVLNLRYPQQVGVKSLSGDNFEVGSQLSSNPVLLRSRGRGPNLVDHSNDIRTGSVGVCTKKLADCKVRICTTAIDFHSCESGIVRCPYLVLKYHS
jgi:hypothetical protein